MTDALTVDLGLILLLACVVAMLTRRARVPYAVGLVAAGVVLAYLPIGLGIPISPEGMFTALLPPLVFGAALQLRWPPFRRELPIVLSLAVLGVTLTAAWTALGMHMLVGWSWLGAAVFGVLIAATDTIAVLAVFAEMDVEPRVSLVIESESLLNDGVAAVGFSVLVAIARGDAVRPGPVAETFVWQAIGGVLVGGGLTWLLLALAGRTRDHLVELTLTLIGAFGAFLVAERLEASGVVAALASGMIVGNLGWKQHLSPNGRTQILAFWEFAGFLANSIVFIVIGLHEALHAAGVFTMTAAAAVLVVLLGRAVSVYGVCALFHRSRLAVDRRTQHVLVWGGVRGAFALILALTLPATIAERREIIAAAFAVVAFSMFAQALTLRPLIQRLGLTHAA